MDNGPERPEPATLDVAQTIAYALATLGLGAVQRSTLRALLPAGEVKFRGLDRRQRMRRGEAVGARKNKTSMRFGQVLQQYERSGWVRRTPDIVYVIDRAALLEHALQGQAASKDLLDVAAALRSVQAEDRAGLPSAIGLIEQRRQELRALTRLMQAPAGAAPAVRIIHKPQLI